MTSAASTSPAAPIAASARRPPAAAKIGLVVCAIQSRPRTRATRRPPGMRASTATGSTPAAARPAEMPAGMPDQARGSVASPWKTTAIRVRESLSMAFAIARSFHRRARLADRHRPLEEADRVEHPGLAVALDHGEVAAFVVGVIAGGHRQAVGGGFVAGVVGPRGEEGDLGSVDPHFHPAAVAEALVNHDADPAVLDQRHLPGDVP